MRRVMFAALTVAALAASVQAGPVLTGSASFDSTSNLWTYSYTVDNSTGTEQITAFEVIVNPYTTDPFFVPLSPITPPGWVAQMGTGVGATFFTVPGAIGYTLVQFTAYQEVLDPVTNTFTTQLVGTPIAPGEIVSGFSFKNFDKPVPDDGRITYAIQGTGPDLTFGYVTAPDDPFRGLPEPSTVVMAATGFVGLGIWQLRRRRR
jgi:hypothetical protein